MNPRAGKKALEAEAKEAGLGIHQVAHFKGLKSWELQEARAATKRELNALGSLHPSPAADSKIVEYTARLNYLDKLIKDRR